MVIVAPISNPSLRFYLIVYAAGGDLTSEKRLVPKPFRCVEADARRGDARE